MRIWLVSALLVSGAAAVSCSTTPECGDADYYANEFAETDPSDTSKRAALHDLHSEALAAC